MKTPEDDEFDRIEREQAMGWRKRQIEEMKKSYGITETLLKNQVSRESKLSQEHNPAAFGPFDNPFLKICERLKLQRRLGNQKKLVPRSYSHANDLG